MTCPVLTFFNNKAGVGKTSLVYHLAWMFAELRKTVVCVDLDPQSNLTNLFLKDDKINDIWNNSCDGTTVFRCVRPVFEGNTILQPQLCSVGNNLFFISGDIHLATFEDKLSDAWSRSLGCTKDFLPLQMMSAFWLVMQAAAQKVQADLILVDTGSNLGAINRSALIASDAVIIPLATNLFSLQGLKGLGPTLRYWHKEWKQRCENCKNDDQNHFSNCLLPQGTMKPLGYICQQHTVILENPIRIDDRWVQHIPSVYREYVLEELPILEMRQENDPYCLAIMRHYRSLVPMYLESRKPIFSLTIADGAIGSNAQTVRSAREDFRKLAQKIATKMDINI